MLWLDSFSFVKGLFQKVLRHGGGEEGVNNQALLSIETFAWKCYRESKHHNASAFIYVSYIEGGKKQK